MKVLLILISALCAFSLPCWRGVNLSGLEWGSALPGTENKDYVTPTSQEADYYTGKGMNFFRLPFKWERLQPQLNGPFNTTYLGYLDTFVNYANQKGADVLLDVHNYARYGGQVIGQGVPTSAFANLWQQLAQHYLNNPNVIFGIMNEPNSMSTELWLSDANAAIAAIRSVGAKQTIFVPGNAWTGAWSWYQNWYGTPNAQVMLGVKDPLNNYVIEVHQYLDSDSSGTHAECVNTTVGSERLTSFVGWARQYGLKAFLAEWAGGKNDVCYSAISDLTNFIHQNSDVVIGWSWWAGGPWWNNYIYNLDPVGGQDQPFMQYLQPHFHCN